VEKNPSLAVNWLATAAKKQHAAAQATLGELLWKGDEVRQRQARGLAFLTLAHENAKAEGDEPKWIADLYQDAFVKSDNATRKEAELLLPELGPTTKTPAATHGPDDHIVIQEAPEGALALPSAAKPTPAAAATPRPWAAPPPAPIGLSVGFGAQPNQP
jgi:exopolysaccharide production negative regulator